MKKSTEKLFLLLLLIIMGVLLFTRFNYRHVPFERDEGEYAYAGSLLLHKHFPYQDAYNMKFPGSYMVYALLMKAGGENIEAVRIGAAVIILITALGIIGITCLLTLNVAASVLAGVIFCALTNTMGGQGLLANSEHFVNLFATWGIFFLVFFLKGRSSLISLFISGSLLGSAVIMKQYGYAFCLFGWVVLVTRFHRQTFHHIVRLIIVFLAGMTLPAFLLLTWIISNGLWQKFYFLTIKYAFAYIGLGSGNTGMSLSRIFSSAIPICILVTIALVTLLLSLGERNARFLLGWIIFSIVALTTGFYLRIHYFILAYPALAVIVAYAYSRLILKVNGFVVKACVVLGFFAFFIIHRKEQFPVDPIAVFNNQYQYGMFADMPLVARHIDSLIPPGDKLSLFSNEPELFFYSGHIAASGYIYNYPLFELQPYANQMTNEYIRQIESNPSRLFVYHTGALQLDNDSVYHRFEKWWHHYSENFYLEGVFHATSATSGEFMTRDELKKNDYMKNSLRIEFWMRKEFPKLN